MVQNDLLQEYRESYPVLEETANRIEAVLREILQNVDRVDQISTRVKNPERFLEKVSRLDEKGNKKYKYPFQEIQDQIGCRVVVFYLSDVSVVADRILHEFNEFEDQRVEGQEPDQFSYRARHFICQIPPEIRHSLKPNINVFEIQISTLFQHAWAEANHDLAYKSPTDLSFENQRYLAFTAAQAWGADKIFEQIWKYQNEKGEETEP